MKKCLKCGKEFEPASVYQKYCSEDCRTYVERRRNLTRATIDRIARKYGFDLQNENKIINAKMIIFKDGDTKFCPCDSANPNRYCGSALCLHDILHNGYCHCNLFHSRKTLEDYKNGK